MKGLFHSDLLGTSPEPSPIGSQLREGDRKNLVRDLVTLPPLYVELSWGWTRLDFLTMPKQSCHLTHHPPLLVAQLLHSSADTGQITPNCLFHYYVSHMLVKLYKIGIIAKTYVKFYSRISWFRHRSWCLESHMTYLIGSHILRSWPGIQLTLIPTSWNKNCQINTAKKRQQEEYSCNLLTVCVLEL